MQIAEGYEKGQHAYHTTMPTDALVRLREVMLETREYGFDKVRQEQIELGAQVRALMESKGFPSVAADGWKAPGVVVSYTTDPGIQNASKFAAVGLQTAARRAAAVRRGARLQELPHRPVRPGQVAQRGAHGGPLAQGIGSNRLTTRPMALLSRQLSTPLGEMLAVASPQGLCLLEFVGQGGVQRELAQVEAARGGPVQPGDSAVLAQTAHELAEYFAGQRQRFGVPLDLVGTPFQLSAWQALLAIPYGQTRSYAKPSPRHRPPQRHARRGGGQRAEQGLHHRALPPRDRQRRQPHRLWRRPAAQAGAAGAGGSRGSARGLAERRSL